MKFLQLAEIYAQAREDEFYFKKFYTDFREFNGVTESVWRTLSYLYGNSVANQLKKQSEAQ